MRIAQLTQLGALSQAPFSNRTACTFNGINEVLSGGDVLDFETTDNFTIACWYKTTQSTQGCMVAKSNGANPNNGYLIHTEYNNAGNAGAIVAEMSGATPYNAINVRTTDKGFNDGSWHLVVMSKSSGLDQSTVTIYIDDMASARTKVVSSNDLARSTIQSIPFCIGGRDYPANPIQMFSGTIKDVSIWSKVLSQAEREALITASAPANLAGHSAKASNGLAWYRMGDGTGDSISVVKNQFNPGTYDLTPANMDASNFVAYP